MCDARHVLSGAGRPLRAERGNGALTGRDREPAKRGHRSRFTGKAIGRFVAKVVRLLCGPHRYHRAIVEDQLAHNGWRSGSNGRVMALSSQWTTES
jgi:hypothetical protein